MKKNKLKFGIILVCILILIIVICIYGKKVMLLTGTDRMDKEVNMNKYKEISLLPSENISYSNPSNIKYIGDPFILEAKEKYYCFPTSAHNGFKVWSSSNLVDWKLEGMAYERTASSWSGDYYWAPEVVEYNNRYYMFYTARTLNNPTLRIGLAISDEPEGPYIDYADKPFYDPGYAVIDASVFIDDDGRKYMYYAIDCSENIVNGNHESHIAVVELAGDLMSVISEPIILSKPDQEWEKVDGDAWAWNEGPIILKHDGLYYMFYSANCFDNRAYSVGYSVSESPTGPFIKNDKPLLWYTKPTTKGGVPDVSGPGHNSLAFSPDKQELFIVYHTHMNPEKPSGDRQVAIDRIGFREDGTLYANGPTIAAQPLPSGVNGYSRIKPDNIKASSANAHILFDGECGMSQDGGLAWKDDGAAWVEMSWNTTHSIAAIAVYPAERESEKLQYFDVIIDDKYIIPDVELKNVDSIPGSSALLNFDPVNASSIKILFHRDQQNVSLSEIMVFSKVE